MKRNNEIIYEYDSESLFDLLKTIDKDKGNSIDIRDASVFTAIRISDKCSFFKDMPFDKVQYMLVRNDKVIITTQYYPLKKTFTYNISNREEFFDAFSQLINLNKVLTDKIIQHFHKPNDTYRSSVFAVTSHDEVLDHKYLYDDDKDDGNCDFQWNAYIDTYTLGGK